MQRNEDLYHDVNDDQYRDQWSNAHMGGSVTIKDRINAIGVTVIDTVTPMVLRDYQIEQSKIALEVLRQYNIAILCFQVRTGKTGTSLNIGQLGGFGRVLFVTKLIAISSIEKDYKQFGFTFHLKVTNYENLHNITEDYDLYICDESHKLGQFPAPAEKTKLLKKMCAGRPVVYLSGTLTPESYSQLFHQLWISSFSPWKEYQTFYKWHKTYGIPAVKYLYNRQIADYSKTKKDDIFSSVKHLILTYTQNEAGFNQTIEEEVHYVPLMPKVKWLTESLKKHKIATLKDGKVILADTAAKELGKLHQAYSGTIKDEEGETVEFETIKAEYIKETFKGLKIAILYKFIAEGMMLGKVFQGRVETDPMAFNDGGTDRVYIGQMISSREGINLSTADVLVMFNIDFAALTYLQAPDRIQTKDRVKPARVAWIFTRGGIEDEIYERVKNKQDFTLSHYKENRKREASV